MVNKIWLMKSKDSQRIFDLNYTWVLNKNSDKLLVRSALTEFFFCRWKGNFRCFYYELFQYKKSVKKKVNFINAWLIHEKDIYEVYQKCLGKFKDPQFAGPGEGKYLDLIPKQARILKMKWID